MVTRNYAVGSGVLHDPVVTYALSVCGDWMRARELKSRLRQVAGVRVDALLRSMVDHRLLVRSDDPGDPRERAADTWGAWNPAAGFFHQSTKNVPIAADRTAREHELHRKYEQKGTPAKIKRYPRARTVALPRVETSGEFTSVLTARRTWRWFSPEPVRLADIATLLQLTCGVQRIEQSVGLGPVHLKTSPSSGARQPLEAYLLAVNVSGLAAGLYHYVPDRHQLELVKRGASRKTVADYVPGQPWYEPAAALLILTAVFERTQWRYPFARAYRSVLLEAGHVIQTFCLVATWLGLAPFCTGRFSDAVIERELKIDGITESYVYSAGIGSRPPGLDWAPWPPDMEPQQDAT